jgi:hypothetical protein
MHVQYKFQILDVDNEVEYQKGMEQLRRQNTALLP